MKKFLSTVFCSPLGQTAVVLLGSLLFIQTLHVHQHHVMDADPDGYCRQVDRERSRSR